MMALRCPFPPRALPVWIALCCFFLGSCERADDPGLSNGNPPPGGGSLIEDALAAVSEENQVERKLICMSVPSYGEPFRLVQANLLTSILATRPGLELQVLDAGGTTEGEAIQIRQALRSRPEVMIIVPVAASELGGIASEVQAAGVPLIVVGAEVPGATPDVHLEVDDHAIGAMAGEFAIQRLKIKMAAEGSGTADDDLVATVAEITGSDDFLDDATKKRSAGFREALQRCPGVEIVHQAPGYWNSVDAAARMIEVLRVQGGVDVVFAHSDAMAHGAFLAARRAGRHSQSLFVGIDGVGGPDGGIAKVRNQQLGGTVSVPLMAEEMAEWVFHFLDGGEAPPLDTPQPEMVTIANSLEKYRKYGGAPSVSNPGPLERSTSE